MTNRAFAAVGVAVGEKWEEVEIISNHARVLMGEETAYGLEKIEDPQNSHTHHVAS